MSTPRSRSTATRRRRPAVRHEPGMPQRTPRRRDSAGLATLEWMLVIAAVGGFAAAMTAGLDRLIDDHTGSGTHSHDTYTASRIAAARINDRAARALTAAHAAKAADDMYPVDALAMRLDELRRECESLPRSYPRSVSASRWERLAAGAAAPGTAADGRWACRLDGLQR